MLESVLAKHGCCGMKMKSCKNCVSCKERQLEYCKVMPTTISIPIRIKLSFEYEREQILEATITTDSLSDFLGKMEDCLDVVRKKDITITDPEYSLNYKEVDTK